MTSKIEPRSNESLSSDRGAPVERAPVGVLSRLIGRPGSVRREQRKFLLIAFVPVIALFLIIRVIPIGWLLGLSFTNSSLKRSGARFVGMQNYARLLDDSQFILSFKNTMEFVIISVPLVIILGLLIALLMNRKLRFEGFYQILFFLPFIISTVPVAIVWKWIYAPGTVGLANYLLMSVGLPRVGWLSDPKITLFAVIIMYVWKNLGYYVVVFLVGLKSIPGELRDAAQVDGASSRQVTRYIDLPLLRPLILFGTIYATIAAMAVFTIVYVMSQGTDVSAGTQISVLAMQIYQEGFVYGNMGYASAIAAVLFVASLLFIVIQFRALNRE